MKTKNEIVEKYGLKLFNRVGVYTRTQQKEFVEEIVKATEKRDANDIFKEIEKCPKCRWALRKCTNYNNLKKKWLEQKLEKTK